MHLKSVFAVGRGLAPAGEHQKSKNGGSKPPPYRFIINFP